MQAEEAKPVVDGAGLCPGYTISRAILADAVALTYVIFVNVYTVVWCSYNMKRSAVAATDT